MLHDHGQTQATNQWKRNEQQHPIDRVFTAYFNTNNPMRHPKSNNYKSETHHIIQRQRVIRSFLNKPEEMESSFRKTATLDSQPKVLLITSIPSPQPLFSGSNERSTNNNNRQQILKKEFDRQSPLLVRRHRPIIGNLSFKQQMSDITNTSANQLSLSVPTNFTFRNQSSRLVLSDRPSYKINERVSSPRIKPNQYSKTIGEVKQNLFQSKNSLLAPIWTPTLSEQDATHTRTLADILRSKTNSTRIFKNRHSQQMQSERINPNLKTNDIQDLCISPRSFNKLQHELEMSKDLTGKKEFIIDEWEEPKSSNDGVSDEDESISVQTNSSTSTCNSQTDIQQFSHQSSSLAISDQDNSFSFPSLSIDNPKPKSRRSSTKRSISRRRVYNLPLAPVAEHVDDEETDMKEILEKISALQTNDFHGKKFDDEDSLTFQLLNQQETEFEKKLSKLRKLAFKQVS